MAVRTSLYGFAELVGFYSTNDGYVHHLSGNKITQEKLESAYKLHLEFCDLSDEVSKLKAAKLAMRRSNA